MKLAWVLALALVLPQCWARELAGPHQGLQALQGSSGTCNGCLAAVHVLEDVLCDPGATDFMVNMALKLCPELPLAASKCSNLAEGLIPVVIQWFRSSTTPLELCSEAGMCTAAALAGGLQSVPAWATRPMVAAPKVAGPECAMCTFVVNKAQSILNDTATLKRLNETMKQVCHSLPSELASSCQSFADTYLPMAEDFIEHIDASTLCMLMGMCFVARPSTNPMLAASTTTGASAKHTTLRSLLPAMGRVAQSVHRSKEAALASLAAPGPVNLGDACDSCKMAVLEAHSLVSSPSIQGELINATKALCDQYPSYADMCKSYIDQYAPMVFTVIEQYLASPDVLCGELGMCPTKPPSTSSKHSSFKSTQQLLFDEGEQVLQW